MQDAQTLGIHVVARTQSNYFMEDFSSKMRADTRTFVLEVINPNIAKSKIDTRLVNGGGNHLRAIKNPQMSMWSLKLENGTLPDALKSSFTSFAAAKRFVEQYYLRRGVKVTEVLD